MLIVSGGFVIVKNTLDERDISGLNRDVEAMYQDRLMAANYIYRMNDLLHKKRGFYADAVLAGKETIETPVYQKELKEDQAVRGNQTHGGGRKSFFTVKKPDRRALPQGQHLASQFITGLGEDSEDRRRVA